MSESAALMTAMGLPVAFTGSARHSRAPKRKRKKSATPSSVCQPTSSPKKRTKRRRAEKTARQSRKKGSRYFFRCKLFWNGEEEEVVQPFDWEHGSIGKQETERGSDDDSGPEELPSRAPQAETKETTVTSTASRGVPIEVVALPSYLAPAPGACPRSVDDQPLQVEQYTRQYHRWEEGIRQRWGLSVGANTSAADEKEATSNAMEDTDDDEDDTHEADAPAEDAVGVAADSAVVAAAAAATAAADVGWAKFWGRRYELFAQFERGVLMDEVGFYSVTPEAIGAHIAERCACGVLVDAFAGVGGNAIQFAFTCERVVAIELDPVRLECARHNAQVYGVADRIEFICGDYMQLLPGLKADVVFLSPPWGGLGYERLRDSFDLTSMPIDGVELFRRTAEFVTPNIAYYLPRNTKTEQLRALAPPGFPVEMEHCYCQRRLKLGAVADSADVGLGLNARDDLDAPTANSSAVGVFASSSYGLLQGQDSDSDEPEHVHACAAPTDVGFGPEQKDRDRAMEQQGQEEEQRQEEDAEEEEDEEEEEEEEEDEQDSEVEREASDSRIGPEQLHGAVLPGAVVPAAQTPRPLTPQGGKRSSSKRFKPRFGKPRLMLLTAYYGELVRE